MTNEIASDIMKKVINRLIISTMVIFGVVTLYNGFVLGPQISKQRSQNLIKSSYEGVISKYVQGSAGYGTFTIVNSEMHIDTIYVDEIAYFVSQNKIGVGWSLYKNRQSDTLFFCLDSDECKFFIFR